MIISTRSDIPQLIAALEGLEGDLEEASPEILDGVSDLGKQLAREDYEAKTLGGADQNGQTWRDNAESWAQRKRNNTPGIWKSKQIDGPIESNRTDDTVTLKYDKVYSRAFDKERKIFPDSGEWADSHVERLSEVVGDSAAEIIEERLEQF